jgi:hypothetical protein
LNVAVVTWRVAKDEMTAGQLTEAANWVLEESWKESFGGNIEEYFAAMQSGQFPHVYFTDPDYPFVFRARGGNQSNVWMGSEEFAIVVTDEPITKEEANAILVDYYGEDDERGRYYRRLAPSPAEQSPEEHSGQ